MTGKISELFAHKVFEIDFPDYDKIQDKLILESSTYFGPGFTSDYNAHDHPIRNGHLKDIYNSIKSKEMPHPYIKLIFDFITEQGKEYWDQVLEYTEHLDPYILNAWITAVKGGGFVASHNHNPIPVAGVFYIKADKGQGNLFLENPSDLFIGRLPYKSNNGYTPHRFNHEIQSKSGKLVLFPGWMKHFTKENTTDDIRISLAVNFGCQGQVWLTDLG